MSRYNVVKISKRGRREVLLSDISKKLAYEIKQVLEDLSKEEDADYPYTIELEKIDETTK